MTRGRPAFRAAPRGIRHRRTRALATGLLTLALLLRALLPAAQALPAPGSSAGEADDAPWRALVLCSALGGLGSAGSRSAGPDGEPPPERPAARSDCLVCQAFGLGQAVAAQPAAAAALAVPSAPASPPPRRALLPGRRPAADPARAPPASRVLP